MSSLGEIRAALAAATERTADARGHAVLARTRLDEAARLLADLSESAADLPRDDVQRAGRDLDDALQIMNNASDLVTQLGDRL